MTGAVLGCIVVEGILAGTAVLLAPEMSRDVEAVRSRALSAWRWLRSRRRHVPARHGDRDLPGLGGSEPVPHAAGRRVRGRHTAPNRLPDVPALEIGTFEGRMPQDVETPAAAGDAPGADGTWSSPQAPGDVPPHDGLTDAELRALRPSAQMTTGELQALDERVDAYLPSVRADQRVTPVSAPGHAPWSTSLQVLDDETEAEWERARWVRSQLPANQADVTREDLERVLAALSGTHPYPAITERALGLADLGPADGRSLAERIVP